MPLCYWTAGASLVEFGDHANAVSYLMSATSVNRGGNDMEGERTSSSSSSSLDNKRKDKLDATGEQSVLNLLGICLRSLGNLKGSVQAFDAGVNLNGASTHELLANSAEAYADMGKTFHSPPPPFFFPPSCFLLFFFLFLLLLLFNK
jgi:hypothetical protein